MMAQVTRINGDENVYVVDNYTVPERKSKYKILYSSLFNDKLYDFDLGSFFNKNPYYSFKDSRKVHTTIMGCQAYYEKMLGQRIDYSFGDKNIFCSYYNIKTLYYTYTYIRI
uniref:Astacin domain-containing protein n=1 Tax=Parastrongyloides trichosuri TaxID=131310 RepID=A0A0N4ZLZ9_PARTI